MPINHGCTISNSSIESLKSKDSNQINIYSSLIEVKEFKKGFAISAIGAYK